MRLRFRRKRLERCAFEGSAAKQAWGPDVGRRYPERIAELLAAPSWEALEALRSLNLHALKGDRQGRYAINLTGRWRIIIARSEADDELIVLNVEDYHR